MTGQNLVVNGSFETGDFTGWTLGGNYGPSPYGPQTFIASTAESGQFAAGLGPVGTDATLSQDLQTTAGYHYTLNFWLANAGAGPNDFTVRWNGVAVIALVNASIQGYTEYTFDVIATGAASQLEFDFRQDPSHWDFDNVAVVEAGPQGPGAPTITSFSPDTGNLGDGITSAPQLSLVGRAAANTTITLFDGAAQIGTTTASGTGAWSFATAILADGTHSIAATATDAVGDTGVASSVLSVTVDTQAPAAPVITSFSPDSGASSDGITNATQLTLAGTAEANSTVKLFDGATLLGTATANGSGAWNYTTGTLSSVAHSFTATATDAATNTGAASSVFSVTVDTQAPPAPGITSFSPDSGVDGDGITNATQLTLAGTAQASSPVDVFDGAVQIGTATANGSGAWSLVTATLANGSHSFTATATDAAGNTGTSSARSVTIDTEAPAAPAITSFSPDTGVIGDGITDVNHVTLTGTAEAGSKVKVFDGAKQVGSATTDGSGAWSFVTATLANGSHSFTATATDAASNTGAASLALGVTVDLTGPAGAPQFANLLNGYAVRPAWQVAGVDYAVGVPAGTALKDPLTIAIAGVTVDQPGHDITVTGDNVTLDGYDFSLDGGWDVKVEGAANLVIKDSNFAIGTTNQIPIWTDVDTSNLTVEYCTFDGGGAIDPTTIWTMIGYWGTSTGPGLTAQYNFFKNSPIDTIQFKTGTHIIQYNLSTNGVFAPEAHPDFVEFEAGENDGTKINFNTLYFTPSNLGGEGIQFEAWDGGVITNAEIGNNVVIASGAPGSLSRSYLIAIRQDPGSVINGVDVHDNFLDDSGAYGPYFPWSGSNVSFFNSIDLTTGIVFLVPQAENVAPTAIALANSAVAENSVNGAVVGGLSASDPNAGETFTFSLPSNPGNLFAINGTNLVVAGALDYETATSHAITVRVTDSANNTFNQNFTIAVTNVAGVTIAGTSGPDTINATTTVAGQSLPTNEEDTIYGGEGNDTINALAGNDIISGGDGDDLLDGGAGNDTLNGGADNDYFSGGAGNDYFSGGSGNDTINGDAGSDKVDAGDGNDTVNGGDGNDPWLGGDNGDDTINGDAGNDALLGGAGNDWLDGGTGADTMRGNAGDDLYFLDNTGDVVTELLNEGIDEVRTTIAVQSLAANVENLTGLLATGQQLKGNALNNAITGGGGADAITGNAGDDTIDGGAGNDNISGNAGNDTLNGGDGNDYFSGGTGNDIINGDAGSDKVDAGDGNDTINGGDGNDPWLGGDNGDDTIYGGGGNDALLGGAGNDWLDGDTGADTMRGHAGDDLYFLDNTGDIVTEALNEGIDEVRTSNAVQSLAANVDNLTGLLATGQQLTGNTLNNVIRGGDGADSISGNDGDDTVSGGAGNDNISGNAGNDTLNGGADNDYFSGGAGNDIINGDAGIDAVDGGAGNDTIDGGDGNDPWLGGDDGDDTIIGGAGNDALLGGAGNDTLRGELGQDSLTGGTGNDAFEFGKADFQAGVYDTVKDFHEVAGSDFDLLRLEGSAADYTFVDSAGALHVIDNATGGSVYINGMTTTTIADQIEYVATLHLF